MFIISILNFLGLFVYKISSSHKKKLYIFEKIFDQSTIDRILNIFIITDQI